MEVLVDFLQDKITKTEVLAVQTATPPTPPPLATTAAGDVCLLNSPPHRPPPQLIAGLIQAAGRPACKRALLTLGPQINYILHGDPLAEPHDYADPKYVECEARHCMTADDLRKIDEGRAAEWAAAQSPKLTAKVAISPAPAPAPRPSPFLHPRSLSHIRSHPRSIRPPHRPVAAPTFSLNATGTNNTWKSARGAHFRGGVSRDKVARAWLRLARGEAPKCPRWAAPGLRAVPRSASPVSCSLIFRTGRQAGRQAQEAQPQARGR